VHGLNIRARCPGRVLGASHLAGEDLRGLIVPTRLLPWVELSPSVGIVVRYEPGPGIGWGYWHRVAAIIWLVVVFLPHRPTTSNMCRAISGIAFGIPECFRVPVQHLHRRPRIRADAAPVVGRIIASSLAMLALGRRPAFRYLGLWFTLALVMLGYMNYRPDRYELVLLPALIAASRLRLPDYLKRHAVPALKPTVPRRFSTRFGSGRSQPKLDLHNRLWACYASSRPRHNGCALLAPS